MWVYIIELQSIQNGIRIWYTHTHTQYLTLFPPLACLFVFCLFSSTLRCCRHGWNVCKNDAINGKENKHPLIETAPKPNFSSSLCKANLALSTRINLCFAIHGSRMCAWYCYSRQIRINLHFSIDQNQIATKTKNRSRIKNFCQLDSIDCEFYRSHRTFDGHIHITHMHTPGFVYITFY